MYDEGGLIDVNLGGFPTYAGLTLPTRPTRRLSATYPKYPLEESEIMLAACKDPKFTPDHKERTTESREAGVLPLLLNTNGTDPKTSLQAFYPMVYR